MTALLLLFGQNVAGQQTQLPENNEDLEGIIAKVSNIQEVARQCAGGECPPLDCAMARKLNAELVEARYVAKYNYFWLIVAAKNHKDVHLAAAESAIRDGKRRAYVQDIAAYQEYVVKIASTMLDLSSAAGNLESLAKDPTSLSNMSPSEFLDKLDTLYEGMKSIESATNTLRVASSGSAPVKVFNSDNNAFNDAKSTVSDLKTLVQEAIKHGKDWRATLNAKNGPRSLGQIVGRILKIYANAEIEERRRLADELANNISANEKVMAAAFREMVRYQSRRNLAEDAHRSLEELFRPGANGSWLQCIATLSLGCGQFDTVRKELKVPDFAQVTFYGDRFDLATADQPGRWGPALQYLTPVMQTISKNLSAVEINEIKPSLALAKTSFKPGEEIKVRFTAPSCYPPRSWIGIVGSEIAHGSETTNAANASGRELLRRLERGEKIFKAPEKEGSYDLRMNDSASGREVAVVSFKVEREDGAGGNGSSNRKSISGVWEWRAGPEKDSEHRKTFFFSEQGDVVRYGIIPEDDTLRIEGSVSTGLRKGDSRIVNTAFLYFACWDTKKRRPVPVPAELIIAPDAKTMSVLLADAKCENGQAVLSSELLPRKMTFHRRDEEQENAGTLSGDWEAFGYTCNGIEPKQTVRIRHVGNRVTAVKIVGDECIGAGEITFRGVFNQDSFAGEMQVSSGEGTPKRFVRVIINVMSPNILYVTGASDTLTLKRKVNQ
ncbi:MAG TPA: hypothetical protein VMM84_14975 [Pyrinomonadaceae bacterium]|nr:hypothetical protein [Pyrinomonadaceae bacterium]